MAERTVSSPAFSLTQARGIVKDLFTPNPVIYWADFLGSLAVGGACFVLVRRVLPPFSLAQIAAFVVCGLCYFRAVLFIHELVHVRDKSFRVFRIVWNLFCGIPGLTPTFMYYTHVEHHMRKHYGTEDDGEYLPLATTSPWHILIYMCQPLVLPAIAVTRFLILAPISWMSPTFRVWVQRHASAMVMDPTYIRPLPTRQALRIFRIQEVLCFSWCAGVATVLALGLVPMGFLYTAYALSVFILTLNNLRTLGAHRYTNPGHEVTFVDQLLDSINYPNHRLISSLWAPVGLRFHALHHLFPSMPYHNLETAHHRLMRELPADSPYRQTVSPSLTSAIVQLLRASWASSRAAKAAKKRALPARQRPMSPAPNSLTGAH